MKIVAIILAGGEGVRLWPLSRQAAPKPFLKVAGHLSLIQRAYLLARNLDNIDEIITLTNHALVSTCYNAYAQLPSSPLATRFIGEPSARNTAAAIALAALSAQDIWGEEVVLSVLSADHLITDLNAFAALLNQGAILAKTGKIVTFGIIPQWPETGYGYIETSENEVLGFREKPDAETAQYFFTSDRHYWNAGIFCFSAKTILENLKQHCPEILQGVKAACTAPASFTKIDGIKYAQIPALSIDHAVMEKTSDLALIPCDTGWSDLGSWSAFAKEIPVDNLGNRFIGSVVAQGAKNCFVHGQKRLISLLGTQDLTVVDTEDAVLIAASDHLSSIRQLVHTVELLQPEIVLNHNQSTHDWGESHILLQQEEHFIEKITLYAQKTWQNHTPPQKCHNLIGFGGAAILVEKDGETLIAPGVTCRLKPNTHYQLHNRNSEPVIVILVGTPDQ